MSAPALSVAYTHVCTVEMIDAWEGQALTVEEVVGALADTTDPGERQRLLDRGLEIVLPGWDARDVALATFDLAILVGWRHNGWHRATMEMAATLKYAEWCVSRHSHHKGKKRMDDVHALVSRWHEALVQMSTGHSHASFTDAEHGTDELLKPLLSAPIAQLREFATRLAERLEHDDRVPFLVWSSFKHMVAPLIAKRPEGAVEQLRTDLAQEIAATVEPSIPREDWVAAIAGALAWRSPTALKEIKQAVDKGAKPRVTGRQSCLFLSAVVDGKAVAQVIL